MKANSKYQINIRGCILFLLPLIVMTSSLLSQERFRKAPPNPEPLAELILPEIESHTLSNGLSLSVIHQENVPTIGLKLIILTGESSSPDDLPGSASLTANMLSRGASTLSGSDIEERIESIGGTFSTSIHADHTIFTFTFLEEYLDVALDILSKMILRPTFTRTEISYAKRAMYYDMVGKISDPEFIAKRHLFRLLFKDHPYEKSAYNEDVIRNIRQKDLLDFFDEHYRPNNAMLILTGNLNLSTASRKVSSYLNTWERKNLNSSFIPPPEPYSEKKICFIDLPKVKDATIYMGNIVLAPRSPDFLPFLVMNQVLGGAHNSRLFMNLRESKGYAYFAFSNVEFFKRFGVFLMRAKVRPDVIRDSIEETFKEIENIAKTRIPSNELEQAKSYLIGNFPLKIEILEELSSRVSEIKVFNLGEEHWSKYYENIMFINSKKVFETAQKYPLLTSVVVIVGDKDVMLDYVLEFDEVDMYDIKGNLLQSFKKGDIE
ncbi:MAG: insulinase family protein [Candidatus Aminicenantes bacterium]|nr:MAG: insulinase family protein [Candidatus Aminicenantes bacterium]